MSRVLELEYYVLNHKMTDSELENAEEKKLVISERELFDLIRQHYIEVDYAQGEYIDHQNFYFTLK